MKKKWLLAAALVSSFVVAQSEQTEAKSFVDVSSSNSSYPIIHTLSEKGIIQGYEDYTFRPQQTITRAHVAIMLGRAVTLTPVREATTFKDVPTTHRYYDDIMRLYKAGIIDGSNGYFKPNDVLTRGQLAKILTNAFQLSKQATTDFSDVPASNQFNTYIGALVESGITTGYEDKTFRPNVPVTRAHFSTFIYRALHMTDEAPLSLFQDNSGYGKGTYERLAVQPMLQSWSGQSRFTGPSKVDSFTSLTTGKTSAESMPAIGVNNLMYFSVAENGRSYVRATTPTGKLIWQMKSTYVNEWTYEKFETPTLAQNNTMYVASDHYVYALETSTGKVKWKVKNEMQKQGPAVLGKDGTVYITGLERIFAYSPSGKLLWQKSLGQWINDAVVVGADGMLYVSTAHPDDFGGSILYALYTNGSIHWDLELNRIIQDEISFDAKGNLYFGTIHMGGTDSRTYSYTKDGNFRWRVSSPEWTKTGVVISEQYEQLYVGSDRVQAIRFDGTLQWEYPLGSERVYARPVIDADGYVYVATVDWTDQSSGSLYKFAPDGELLWSKAMPGAAHQALALTADHSLLIYIQNWEDDTLTRLYKTK